MSTSVWYEYECANGHGCGWDKPLTRCYAYWNGKPCTGALKQVSGPRSPRKPKVQESVTEAIAKLPVAAQRRLAAKPPRR